MAEDAADLVTMEIAELPPLLDAMAEPGEFAPGRTTEATIVRQGYGEVEEAFAAAHRIVELTLSVGRHTGVPLETRGAIGRYDGARDILELHGAAKVPHRNRDLLARMLELSPSSIHVHEAHVGGGFGIRGELYPEDVLVCVAAMRLGRPVKWIEDRREHLICANHSRQQTHRIRAAVDADGQILAIDDEFWHDQGAYVRTHATRVAMMICGILPGPYRVPAYRSIGHFRLTNKTPAATYRAPGRYETTFVRERLVDAIALELGIDPNDVRRRNAITSAEMPYARPLEALGEEIHYDTGDYLGLFDKVLERVDWETLKVDLKRRRAAGELVGAGIAMFVEKSGLGPTDGAACLGRHVGRRRGGHRRRLDRARLRDRGGAGLCRHARRRLPPRPRRAWPDRPHRLRHRRACLARHRDDRVGDAHRGPEGAAQGARGRGRTAAGLARRPHHRGRPDRAEGCGRRCRRSASAPSPRASRPPPRRLAGASRAWRRKAGSMSSTRFIPTERMSRW